MKRTAINTRLSIIIISVLTFPSARGQDRYTGNGTATSVYSGQDNNTGYGTSTSVYPGQGIDPGTEMEAETYVKRDQEKGPDIFAGSGLQAEDSLGLVDVIRQVIESHPSVKAAREAMVKADAQVGLARSGYYPNATLSASYSHVGPVPSLEIPDRGKFSFMPSDNFSSDLGLSQNIYDFGRTANTVEMAMEGKDIAGNSLEQVKQQMSLQVIHTFYALNYLQEALRIKAGQLQTLQEHLAYVKKMKETGSATDYDVLSTEVKIATVETQQLDLEAALEVQLSALNTLMGLPVQTYHRVKALLAADQPGVQEDSLISHALQNRREMMIAMERTSMARTRLKVVQSQNNPSLNFVANGGVRNGYVPDINKIKANYMVGLKLSIPVLQGTRNKYNLMEARSSIESSLLETEITQRRISAEVMENETGVETALKKEDHSRLQLRLAEQALAQAQMNYRAGVITNLDLLDAATSVSESRLMLLKSRIDYVVSVYRLKAALGEQLY